MDVTRQVRAYGYQMFYRMPGSVRRRLVRVLVRKYLVGAVTLVYDSVAPEPGRLLLLRQPPGRGWSLPAGLLKRREHPAVGAARELAEESGISVHPERLTPAVPNAIVHAEGWVDMVYTTTVPADDTQLSVDGAEVLEAAWFPVNELPPMTRSTTKLLGFYGIGPAAA